MIAATQSVILSAQGILAAVSGEVARRSASSNDASLARRLGERSARRLIATRAGLTFGAASQYVAVGEMIRPNLALSGETLPADREHVAAAVRAGLLPMSVAELIDETVHRVEHRMVLDQAAETERELVDEFLSGQHSIAQFTAHCHQLVELLDPDGTAPRGDDLRAKAFIRETWLPNGMLRIVAELDPERAAFYRAALRAKTNPRRPEPNDEPTEEAGTGSNATGANVTDLGAKRDSLTCVIFASSAENIRSDQAVPTFPQG